MGSTTHHYLAGVPCGTIHPDECYTRAELLRRLEWTPSSLRAAVRDGLIGRRLGKSSAFLGSDVIAYIRQRPTVGGGKETRNG
jgi:hypothetical protein